jgi:hypothetical protein
MRSLRESAFAIFLSDFETHPQHYIAGELSATAFRWRRVRSNPPVLSSLRVSRLLRLQIPPRLDIGIMRVTSGQTRMYPIVAFEAHVSEHVSMLRSDQVLQAFRFSKIETDFEFLRIPPPTFA